jgi:hypothetical protein
MKPADQSRRLVLAAGFNSTGLPELLHRFQWPFEYFVPQGATVTTERVWRISDVNRFHVFECTNYPVEYCIVSGKDPNQVLSQVSVYLDFLDVDDLCRAFDGATTPDDTAIVTFALGLSSDDTFDQTIYERLLSALSHPNPRVRLAAIDGAFVTGWPVFKDQFKRLSETDTDPQVSQMAATAFAEFCSP